MSEKELLQCHLQTMFVFGGDGTMLLQNEPWLQKGPAPRLFIIRGRHDGVLYRYGDRVAKEEKEKLQEYLEQEKPGQDDLPKFYQEYMKILGAAGYTAGPCYKVPEGTGDAGQTVLLDGENIHEYELPGRFAWLADEVGYTEPCAAKIVDGKVVAVCFCSRIGPGCEAGAETLEEYRGKGYAGEVTARWAGQVYAMGKTALYSTGYENAASRQVAKKLGLEQYGASFSIQ